MSLPKLNARIDEIDSLLCIGLDSDYTRLPASFQTQAEPQFAFNRWIIEQTHPFASAYKPNMAFYEARGDAGMRELKRTLDYLREHHPRIFTICDAKRGDIGPTNRGYVEAIFDWLGFDAVTLSPYLGGEALAPFLERADKTAIILCRTSNPGAGELQDLRIAGEPLWSVVARTVAERWNAHGNCMLVVGATYPAELATVRAVIGAMPVLVPGIGAQGGSIEAAVRAGLDREGRGLLINASRSILFGDDPRAEAQRLRDAINQFRSAGRFTAQ